MNACTADIGVDAQEFLRTRRGDGAAEVYAIAADALDKLHVMLKRDFRPCIEAAMVEEAKVFTTLVGEGPEGGSTLEQLLKMPLCPRPSVVS